MTCHGVVRGRKQNENVEHPISTVQSSQEQAERILQFKSSYERSLSVTKWNLNGKLNDRVSR